MSGHVKAGSKSKLSAQMNMHSSLSLTVKVEQGYWDTEIEIVLFF